MNNPVRAAKPAAKAAVALTPPFSMKSLWRLAIWGGTAAGALLIAVLATHSEVGSQRAVGVLSSLTGRQVALVQADRPVVPATPVAPAPVATGGADVQNETRRLAEAVRNLAADNSQLKSRLAAVENNLGDLTGSVTRQIDEVKSAGRATPSWPDDPTAPVNAAVIASLVSPSLPPPDGLMARRAPAAAPAVSPAPAPAPAPTAAAAPVAIAPVAVAPVAPAAIAPVQSSRQAELARVDSYGIDIGSGLSIQALRARWAGMRSAHPEFFDALTPVVNLKEKKPGSGLELRLVAGPVASPDTAVQLCAALAPLHLYCQPTTFSGQPLTP